MLCEIRTRNPSNPAATDARLRPRGQRNWMIEFISGQNQFFTVKLFVKCYLHGRRLFHYNRHKYNTMFFTRTHRRHTDRCLTKTQGANNR